MLIAGPTGISNLAVIAIPPPAATVDVALVVTVIVKVLALVFVISWFALSSDAGIPPTAVAPEKVT